MSGGGQLRELWDFDDPPGSEERLRGAARAAPDESARERATTQVARALGLQGRFEEGHALLDSLACDDAEVQVRAELERGRLLRSADHQARARPRFEAAATQARAAGLDELLVDALHMRALVVPPDEQAAATQEALAVARASEDVHARAWEASLLNNLGMVHADAGEFDEALRLFEEALTARRRDGRPETVRVARWMVAWAMRNLGRDGEALVEQEALRAELVAAGEDTTYVDEELSLLGAPPTSPP